MSEPLSDKAFREVLRALSTMVHGKEPTEAELDELMAEYGCTPPAGAEPTKKKLPSIVDLVKKVSQAYAKAKQAFPSDNSLGAVPGGDGRGDCNGGGGEDREAEPYAGVGEE